MAASSSEALCGKALGRSWTKVCETKRAQSTTPVNKSEFAACHQSDHFNQNESFLSPSCFLPVSLLSPSGLLPVSFLSPSCLLPVTLHSARSLSGSSFANRLLPRQERAAWRQAVQKHFAGRRLAAVGPRFARQNVLKVPRLSIKVSLQLATKVIISIKMKRFFAVKKHVV